MFVWIADLKILISRSPNLTAKLNLLETDRQLTKHQAFVDNEKEIYLSMVKFNHINHKGFDKLWN
ncbi:hypothetical protein [Floridanema evergladense]|uniref:Uncharacterized protein n=1 Tax=Floridaenema evergladense BLCC-F167 TaxID=3153639 RepID=A0ABV4WWU0_9CYAN